VWAAIGPRSRPLARASPAGEFHPAHHT
jgi:hypothetical protein